MEKTTDTSSELKPKPKTFLIDGYQLVFVFVAGMLVTFAYYFLFITPEWKSITADWKTHAQERQILLEGWKDQALRCRAEIDSIKSPRK